MNRKQKTYEQVEAAQARAVQFAENVLDDSDLASELESLTPEEYAERKHWDVGELNPCRRQCMQHNITRKRNFFGFGSSSPKSEYKDILKSLRLDPCNTGARARIAKLAPDANKSLADLKKDLRSAGLTTAQILDVAEKYRSKRNPIRKEVQSMPTIQELKKRIAELEAENEELSDKLDAVYAIASGEEEIQYEDEDED